MPNLHEYVRWGGGQPPMFACKVDSFLIYQLKVDVYVSFNTLFYEKIIFLLFFHSIGCVRKSNEIIDHSKDKSKMLVFSLFVKVTLEE